MKMKNSFFDKCLKALLSGLLIVVVSSLIGLLLLTITFSLPDHRIQKNTAGSVWMIEGEGLYPERINGLNSTKMDNWTDALMLNNSSFESDQFNLMERVLKVPRAESRENPIHSLRTYYFEDYVNVKVETYERYWHGYITFLRPLLLIGDYSVIRFIYFVAHILLLTYFLRVLEKKVSLYASASFLVAYLCVAGFVTPFSLQYSTIMFLIFISGIFMLKMSQWLSSGNRLNYYFLILGIVTVYFDYLTYPIAVLGVNLCLYLLMNKMDARSFGKMLNFTFLWFFGYGSMWAMKWLLSTVILGDNVFMNAFAAIRERSGNTGMGNHLTPLFIIEYNLKYLNSNVVKLLVAICLSAGIFINRKCLKNLQIKNALPLLIIVLLPFIWVSVLLNHSYIHGYFTYRSFIPALFGLLLLPELMFHTVEGKKSESPTNCEDTQKVGS